MNSLQKNENCYDLMRLLLAGSVIYSHAYLLGGYGEEWFSQLIKGQAIAGTIGVLGFFGLSGFLVTASYISRDQPTVFILHRIKRIFPAFVVCLAITAFIFAPLLEWCRSGSLIDFAWAGEGSAVSYMAGNLFLYINQWTVGQSVDGLPYSGSINGPLWSLFPEFCCYLGVLIAGFAGFFKRGNGYLLLGGAGLFVIHVIRMLNPEASYPAIPSVFALTTCLPFIIAFVTGSLCFLYREQLRTNFIQTLVLFTAGVLLLRFGGWQLIGPVLFPLLLINAGELFTFRLKHDFSYGLYIYGFPCQQLLARSEIADRHVVLFMVLSLGMGLVCAAASWFLVERRFLMRKNNGASPG